MKNKGLVSGFTFIKNGLKLGYPFVESIESIAPLCDEVIINIGHDPETPDDGTEEILRKTFTHPKFIFIKNVWDPKLTENGLILSQQTNLALEQCQYPIAFYIQGDEAVHQEDYPAIHDGIIHLHNNPELEGLVFDYHHFYGNVDIIKHTRNVYRREVRIIRNHIGLKSHLDAQSFRFKDGRKPQCKLLKAHIYHYGWARESSIMDQKIKAMDKLYHGQEYERFKNSFEYRRIWGLRPFKGTHPKIMNEWIEQNRNQIDIMSLKLKMSLKDYNLALADFIEKYTGYRIGEYKSYKLLDPPL